MIGSGPRPPWSATTCMYVLAARARLRRGVRAGPAARRGPARRGGRRGRVRVRAVAAGPGRPPARPLHRRHRAGAGDAGPRARLVAAARLPAGAAADRAGRSPGWLVAAWQISLGFGIGLPFAYFLLAARAGRRPAATAGPGGGAGDDPRSAGRLLVADLAGGAVFGAVTLLLALAVPQGGRACTRRPSGRSAWIEHVLAAAARASSPRPAGVVAVGRAARGARGQRCPGRRR